MSLILSSAIKLAASKVISSLFDRSSKGKTDTQLDTYRELENKTALNELPQIKKSEVRPKENFTDNIGNNTVDSQYSSLYESLAEDSKQQVNASYEVYNNLNEKLQNTNERLNVLSENLDKTKSSISAYGQVTGETVTKATGFLSKLSSTIKGFVNSAVTTIISTLAAPILGLQSLVKGIQGRYTGTTDDPDLFDLPLDPSSSETASAASSDAQGKIDVLTEQREELEHSISSLTEKEDRLKKFVTDHSINSEEDYNKLTEDEKAEFDSLKSSQSERLSKLEKDQNTLKSLISELETQKNVKKKADYGLVASTVDKLGEDVLNYDVKNKAADRLISASPKTDMNKVNKKLNLEQIKPEEYDILNSVREWLFDHKNGMSDENIKNLYFKDDDYVTTDTIAELRKKGKITTQNATPMDFRTLFKVQKHAKGLKQEALGQVIGSNIFSSLNESTADRESYNRGWKKFRSNVLGSTIVANEDNEDKTLDHVDSLLKSYENSEFKIINNKNNEEVNLYQLLSDLEKDRRNLANYSFEDSNGKDITEEFINTAFPSNLFASIGSGEGNVVMTERGTISINNYKSNKSTNELVHSDEPVKTAVGGETSHTLARMSNYPTVGDLIEKAAPNGDYVELEKGLEEEYSKYSDYEGYPLPDFVNDVEMTAPYYQEGVGNQEYEDLVKMLNTIIEKQNMNLALTSAKPSSASNYTVNFIPSSVETDG